MAAVELELDYLVWTDKNGVEQITPAHTIPSGTRFIANQTTAPVGWTKETVHNDKSLRVTNGTVGIGGNSPFNTVFGKTTTDGHTMTESEMPSHKHNSYGTNWNITGAFAPVNLNKSNAYSPGNRHVSSNYNLTGMYNTGGSQPHKHNMDLRVQYIDVIIVIKD